MKSKGNEMHKTWTREVAENKIHVNEMHYTQSLRLLRQGLFFVQYTFYLENTQCTTGKPSHE